MPITVRNEFELQVTSTNVAVGRLKQLVERRMHIPAALQSLFCNGMELQDDGTLVQFGVDLNSTLFLIVRGDGNQENPLLLNEDDEQGPDDAVGHFDETHGYGFNISDPYHQMDDRAANQTEPEMLPVMANLHIVKPGLFDTLTVIEMRWTDTVYRLKEEIQRCLGHDIWSQTLDVGGSPLDNQSRLQDIPELIKSPIMYLSIMSVYWLNNY